LKRRVSCVLVRYYVAKYTVAAAEAYARGKGASEAQIEAARHCLPPTLTAVLGIIPCGGTAETFTKASVV
jgi:hypothetical protein